LGPKTERGTRTLGKNPPGRFAFSEGFPEFLPSFKPTNLMPGFNLQFGLKNASLAFPNQVFPGFGSPRVQPGLPIIPWGTLEPIIP